VVRLAAGFDADPGERPTADVDRDHDEAGNGRDRSGEKPV
jgi:hypothetical protein